MDNKDVLFFIDRASFPVTCPELEDFKMLTEGYSHFELNTDDPTTVFREALKASEKYELVVPVTRNFYVRDRLKMEGVSLIISL